MKLINQVIFLFALSLITACSSAPNSIIFYTDVSFDRTTSASFSNANITVTDERPLYALVTIQHPDDSKTFLQPSSDILLQLNKQFRKGFATNGITHDLTAQTAINVRLIQAHVDIMQTHFNYKASLNLEILIEVNKTPKKFTRTFYASGEQQGPLSFDRARIERDLNELAGRLINDIINDQDTLLAISP